MPRFLLTIAFDGTNYFGWQRQRDDQPSVQGVMETAIADLAGRQINVYGASRTDRGVHARAFSAHIDLDTRLRDEELRRAIDVRLPEDVSLVAVREVEPDFHARYQARGKCYAYRIHNARSRDPLSMRYSHHFPRTLDVGAMREAAAQLTGTHDFSAFATLLSEHENRLTSQPEPDKPEKPEGNIRTLTDLCVIERASKITFLLFGDGFLRGMVRGIVGTLLDAGLGKLSRENVRAILESRDRREAGANMPACGLTLEKVFYEDAELTAWCERGRDVSLRRPRDSETGNNRQAGSLPHIDGPPELNL